MSLQHIPLLNIREADLLRLVTDSVRESGTLEYKQAWMAGSSDGEKREFLADVSAFANAEGGDIVYGIEARDGVAQTVSGLEGFSPDKEQLRAEQLLAAGLDPRLSAVAFRALPLASGRTVFIVRVGRSANPPHMVIVGGTQKIFSRHSAGKLPMNMDQIRAAVHRADEGKTRVDALRNERIQRIAIGDVGVKLWSDTCVVLHVLPLHNEAKVAPQVVINESIPLRPMGRSLMSFGHQMTADGLMVRSSLPVTGRVKPSHFGAGQNQPP